MEMAVLNAALSQIVGIVVAGLAGWVAASAKQHSRYDKAMRDGMKSVLRKELVDAYDKYVADGCPMTVERRHELEEAYRSYRALGGNGTGEAMYKAISQVPISVIGSE